MNSFLSIHTDYVRPSRTIDTVLVSNSKTKKLFYVYNYEGYSLRVFETVLSLIKFFEGYVESDLDFDSESELDNFFSQVELRE
jgi:hypothetical protein